MATGPGCHMIWAMLRSILHQLRIACTVPLLTGCVLIGSAVAQGTPARLDSSDWWSYTRQEELPYQEPQHPIHFQSREPAENNFQIAGVTLDAPRHDFSVIRSKFGALKWNAATRQVVEIRFAIYQPRAACT
jgi:hypothetical protein